MVKVKVISSNDHVWNLSEVVAAITSAKNNDQDLVLDLNDEGPDFEALQLMKFISNWDNRTTVVTRNPVQRPVANIQFEQNYPHFITNAKNALQNVDVTKQIEKPFGIFIGRSNSHRLYLSSYIYNHCHAHQTFRYDYKQTFHRNNLGLEQLIDIYGLEYIEDVVKLIKKTPLTVNNDFDPQGNNDLTYCLHTEYKHFLIEIVCETFFTGNCFFPTEKTWRPIMLETPFIVQGPQWYLHRLRDLGFRTFDHWWDEGYAEDPADHQPKEIIKIIDFIKQMSVQELDNIYKEMQPILKHNKNRFMELTSKDFEIFKNDSY